MAVSLAADLQPVQDVTSRLRELLRIASEIKPETTVDPPLPTSEILEGINALHEDFDETYDQDYRLDTAEAAARDIFYSTVGTTSIYDPAYGEVWNLLDILLVCGDQGKCGAVLQLSLLEELLDSLSTDGCRIAFVYLESRRERLAQTKFLAKSATILRFSNELLRRLSRAEDAILCGRVFFFLFQSFPLGDRSSVNLRGNFHVENTTKFEELETETQQDGDQMDVDADPVKAESETSKAATPQPPTRPGSKAIPIKAPPEKEKEKVISNSELYPIFWQLQSYFSDPTRLFAEEHFQAFKKGLNSTIAKFKDTPTVVQAKAVEDGKRGVKRKLGENEPSLIKGDASNGEHAINNSNPKYLTSRDLFDLELSDLAFQRHILVQALILIDFLLSLTERAKKRTAELGIPNRGLLRDFILSDEEAKWVTATRTTITTFFSATLEGKLFNRMVETVLARDKNWIRWKENNCPSITKDPVSAESALEARKSAQTATRVRRVPSQPVGSMDLSFLKEGYGGGLDALKAPERFSAPSVEALIDGIKSDELDLEMAADETEALGLRNAIANKRWRILRRARAGRLEVLNKIELKGDLEQVFRPPPVAEVEMEGKDGAMGNGNVDDDAHGHLAAELESESVEQNGVELVKDVDDTEMKMQDPSTEQNSPAEVLKLESESTENAAADVVDSTAVT